MAIMVDGGDREESSVDSGIFWLCGIFFPLILFVILEVPQVNGRTTVGITPGERIPIQGTMEFCPDGNMFTVEVQREGIETLVLMHLKCEPASLEQYKNEH